MMMKKTDDDNDFDYYDIISTPTKSPKVKVRADFFLLTLSVL
jgi:hypothetical protein